MTKMISCMILEAKTAPLPLRMTVNTKQMMCDSASPLQFRHRRPRISARNTRRMIVKANAVPQEVQTTGPLSLNSIASFAKQIVMDALLLIQRLFQLVNRVRLAAESIQASIDSATKQPIVSPTSGPLSLISKATFKATVGAITHLRHTLTDTTGTLDTKWQALENTSSEQLGGLYNATTASAAVRDAIQLRGKTDPQHRDLARKSNEAVIVEEEALRQQVFAQVYAELKMKAMRGDTTNNGGFMPKMETNF